MLPQRRKNGRFRKKAKINTRDKLPDSLLLLATIAMATDAPVVSPEIPNLSLTPPKKRKIRKSDCEQLANENVYSERYSRNTLKYDGVHSLLIDKGLNYGDPYKRFKRAKKAGFAARIYDINDDGEMFECTADKRRMVGEGLQASRRCAIAYFFEHIFGNPDESEWAGRGGVISRVMKRLHIPLNSMHLARKVFEDVAQAIKDNKNYDAHSGPRERGRKVAIEVVSPEANIVFAGMKSGIGITETTVLLNDWAGL